jgi:peptidoglycan/xylan/chitin deacetylase (PgdA/CDA1 family)
VDLDGALDIYRMWGWEYPSEEDVVFQTGLANLLDLFARNRIQATLFVIASSLENPRKRLLIEEAVRRGHEIASHTMTHPNLLRVSREQKRDEIVRSREAIQERLGVDVRGFRAPGYLMDREGIEIAAASGYAYDASFFPTRAFARRMQCPIEKLTRPHRPLEGQDFLELPLPDHRPSPVPFNPSYAMLFGVRYFRWGLRRHRRSGSPLVMLFHLIDASAPLPRTHLAGWGARIATLSGMPERRKIKRCQQMLSAIRAAYRIVPTKELIEECQAARAREAVAS